MLHPCLVTVISFVVVAPMATHVRAAVPPGLAALAAHDAFVDCSGLEERVGASGVNAFLAVKADSPSRG